MNHEYSRIWGSRDFDRRYKILKVRVVLVIAEVFVAMFQNSLKLKLDK